MMALTLVLQEVEAFLRNSGSKKKESFETLNEISSEEDFSFVQMNGPKVLCSDLLEETRRMGHCGC